MPDTSPLKSASETLAAGRRVQNGRIRAISENIANAESTADRAGGAPYARKVAVFTPVVPDAAEPRGRVARDTGDFRTRHDPGDPAADARGLVRLPNVALAVENADLQAAIRNYEISLGAAASIDSLTRATLDLLK